MSTLCVPSHIPNVADDCEQIHKAFSAAGVVAVADDSLINGGELAVENAAAGFATVTFSHPLDVVRTRFQVNDGRLSNLPTYKNTPHALFTIARSESKTKLFFGGQLIWDAIMDELLAIGMSSAREGVAKSLNHDCVGKSEPSKTLAEAVGDWYFKRAAAKHIDCQYPCNPTCYHRDLSLV